MYFVKKKTKGGFLSKGRHFKEGERVSVPKAVYEYLNKTFKAEFDFYAEEEKKVENRPKRKKATPKDEE